MEFIIIATFCFLLLQFSQALAARILFSGATFWRAIVGSSRSQRVRMAAFGSIIVNYPLR